MKTQQEIAEMAEREYPIPKGVHYLDSPTTYKNYVLQQAFIKGYQAAQEDKSLLSSILRHCDKYPNDADLGREIRKWMSKPLIP